MVFDSASGEPIKGAMVSIEGTDFRDFTSQKGHFVISNVPNGDYTIVITRLGYQTLKHGFGIIEGETKKIDFALSVKPIQLNEIIVTRTSLVGNKERLIKIPGSAHFLGAEDLAKFEYNDISRILREIPGINIQEEDGYGLRPNIGLRGTGVDRSQKIAIMEDGVLIAPAPYSAPAAYYFPTVGRMNSIEVRKGSSQIKYGPFTTGGAINMISTPIPADFAGRVELLYGEDEARRIHTTAGNTFKNFGFMAETFQEKVDGFKKLDGGGNTGYDKKDYTVKLSLFTDRDSRVYQQVQFKLSQTDEISNETYLGLTDADFAASPFRRYAGSQQDEMNTDHDQIQARYFIKPSDNIDVTTTIYRNEFKRNWYKLDKVRATATGNAVGISRILAEPETYAREYDIITGQTSPNDNALIVKANNRQYYAQGIESVLGLQFNLHEAEFGVRYHEDELDRFQWEDQYRMQNGVMMLTSAGTPGTESNQISNAKAWASFFQLNLSFGKLLAVPGIRYENIKLSRVDYGKSDPQRLGADLTSRENKVVVIIPGAGLDYRFTNRFSAFLGVHKGFAPPGSSEGTNPEESINYELGIRYRESVLNFQGVLFFNDYSNLLGSDLTASGGTGTGDQFNGGEVDVKGLELSLNYNIAAIFSRIRHVVPLRLTYTYTDGKFKNEFESEFEPWGKVAKNDELPYLPKHQFYTGLGYETPDFNLNLGAKYVSKMRTTAGQGEFLNSNSTDAHLIIDASADYAIAESVNFFMTVKNMTDEIYVAARRPAGLRPGLPRTLTAGLKTNF